METAWANEASSSSSISTQFKYDVVLGFSGVDTCNKFASHLLAALEQHGFHTFRGDKKLNRGEYIGGALLKAIEGSRISLVVFSKNYATSKWWLDELVKIMECMKTLQQIVLPIFCDVETSDVRAQRGSLAEAFAKHEECLKDCSDGRVKKWREALTEVANLSGWHLPKEANGQESLDYPGKRSRLWYLEDPLKGLSYGKVRVVCPEFLNNCPLRNQHQHEEDMVDPPPHLSRDLALLQQPLTPAALPISRTKPYAGISQRPTNSGESDMASRTGSPLEKQENPNYHCGLGCSVATGSDDPPPYLSRDLALLQQPLTPAAPPISRTKPYAGISQWRTGSPLLQQENPNDHFVLGCSVATGSDDFEAVGTGSESTVECQMAGRNFDTLPPSNQVMASIDTDIVTVKAKHQTYTIKFQLSRPWGMAKLEEQVQKRLKELDAGTYLIKYKDEEGEMILIACDEDLQFYIKRSRLQDPTTSIVVFLERK